MITAKNDSSGQIVSGGMAHSTYQTYGKYRVRVRTDADYSEATSAVVLTWPRGGDNQTDGENNIYETGWGDPSRKPFFTYIHEPFQDPGPPTEQAWIPHYADGTQWQVLTMEWTPDRIRIVREGPGDESWTEHIVNEKTDDDVIPDVDHSLRIQLDAFKPSTPNVVKMEVDYIEFWEYCG